MTAIATSIPLSPVVEEELRRFQEEIENLESGAGDPDDFKRFRLENGVYGIRGQADRHMVRIKIPFGRLNPEQLEQIADITEQYTPGGVAHVTTRQDIQLHYVRRRDVPQLLRRLAECGLTTREACGNTVRNVTGCPYAGVSPTEPFDVTPYAEATSKYFLRNPVNQSMPRKFKIAFEGCSEDHARTAIHDVGAVAKLRTLNGVTERGFQIYLAGGLGAQPRSASLLEEFTPASLLIPTIEAAIRVFDRNGERRPEQIHRMRARMKFVVREWGWERFRNAVLKERKVVLATRSGLMPMNLEPQEETAPNVQLPVGGRLLDHLVYRRWLKTNVTPQKQTGWHVVSIRCPLGDISPAGLRDVARISRKYCGGRLRASITQNLILRWTPTAALPWVYSELAAAGLAASDVHQLADITRCPGADTCQIALTHSRALSSSLTDVIQAEFLHVPEVRNLSIKISGCMNSCGQHHIADIGLHGAAVETDGRTAPAYILMLGGRTQEGLAEFGRIAGRIPARLAPDAVRRLLRFYVEKRAGEETFRDLLDRLGITPFKRLIKDLTDLPTFQKSPELFSDLGETDAFQAEVGVGECAG